VVHDIVTELGWIKVTDKGLVLVEIADGITIAEVQAKTEAWLRVSPDLRVMAAVGGLG
jgi:3-oxoacid CoA-transferase subunit B